VDKDWFVLEIPENAGGLFEKRKIFFLKGRKRWGKLKSSKGRTKRRRKKTNHTMMFASVFDFPLFSKRGRTSGARGTSNWPSSSPSSSLANLSSKKAALSFLSVYSAI